jgi:peptidoglycan/xylan/chitin deacetylase (PgdA/CDA1 family)
MIVNLCFHGIGTCVREREPGESRYWVAEDMFSRILDHVVDRSDVRLSFDDGNASDAAIALPALRERGLTATFFVLAGRLDDRASLGASEIRDLRATSMRIGSHGWSHVPWRGLSDIDAHRELVEARQAIAEVSGAFVDEAAMPLGRYDRQLVRRLRAADYRHVFTSDRMPAGPGSWMQPRYSATANDTTESIAAIVAQRLTVRTVRNVAAGFAKRIR